MSTQSSVDSPDCSNCHHYTVDASAAASVMRRCDTLIVGFDNTPCIRARRYDGDCGPDGSLFIKRASLETANV